MSQYKLIYKPMGSIAVLIEWPYEIDKKIISNIRLFKSKIKIELSDFIIDTVPAYNSLTVFFDTEKIKYSSIVKKIKELYELNDQKLKINSILWKIPVCYDEIFGIDINEIARVKRISKERVIKIHSDVIYDVFFIGFLPGFLYMGGLSEELHSKRKSKPRRKIEKGAIGIAGDQTGIYPRESPGGWNIIGNSPINIFDVRSDPPCFAKAGDKIQFVPIDLNTHQKIAEQIKSGTYIIEKEVYEQ
ncbi:MAG: 5-oxoprolinase subunit PxpB [Bacteroidota bacterium]